MGIGQKFSGFSRPRPDQVVLDLLGADVGARCCCRDFSSTSFSSSLDAVRIAVAVVIVVVDLPVGHVVAVVVAMLCS